MSKTQKTALIIAALAMPFILFAGIFVAGIIGNEMITQKDVEEYGKKIQPKSGIVFPADTIFVNGHWVKYFAFLAQERPAGWSYISKEPFQLPENIKVRVKTSNTDTFKKLFRHCLHELSKNFSPKENTTALNSSKE